VSKCSCAPCPDGVPSLFLLRMLSDEQVLYVVYPGHEQQHVSHHSAELLFLLSADDFIRVETCVVLVSPVCGQTLCQMIPSIQSIPLLLRQIKVRSLAGRVTEFYLLVEMRLLGLQHRTPTVVSALVRLLQNPVTRVDVPGFKPPSRSSRWYRLARHVLLHFPGGLDTRQTPSRHMSSSWHRSKPMQTVSAEQRSA